MRDKPSSGFGGSIGIVVISDVGNVRWRAAGVGRRSSEAALRLPTSEMLPRLAGWTSCRHGTVTRSRRRFSFRLRVSRPGRSRADRLDVAAWRWCPARPMDAGAVLGFPPRFCARSPRASGRPRGPELRLARNTGIRLGLRKWYRVNVKTSDPQTSSTQTRRRATETGTLVGTRFQSELLEAIDGWRKLQVDLPTRPEAVRRLVELGMAADSSMTKPVRPRDSDKVNT
jgi:hypothetical protein